MESFDLGDFGEDHACRFLRKKGCKILNTNYRTAGGEIDIVAKRGNTVIFVEVKTRSSNQIAQPWEAVGYRKRQKMKSAAREYVQAQNLRDCEFRFDVISITVNDSLQPDVEWIESAF